MKKLYEEPKAEWILLTSEEDITQLPDMSGGYDPDDDPFA